MGLYSGPSLFEPHGVSYDHFFHTNLECIFLGHPVLAIKSQSQQLLSSMFPLPVQELLTEGPVLVNKNMYSHGQSLPGRELKKAY